MKKEEKSERDTNHDEVRTAWALCIAAYVLIVSLMKPFSIIRAEIDSDNPVIELPHASNSYDLITSVLSVLSMYVVLEPFSYASCYFGDIPYEALALIGVWLNLHGYGSSNQEIIEERDRLIGILSEILLRNQELHSQLAIELMKGPLTSSAIERIIAGTIDDCEDLIKKL